MPPAASASGRTLQSSIHSTVSGTLTPCSFHSAVIPHFTAMAPDLRLRGSDPGFAMPISSNIQSFRSACSLMFPGLAMDAAVDVAMDRAADGAQPAAAVLQPSRWSVATAHHWAHHPRAPAAPAVASPRSANGCAPRADGGAVGADASSARRSASPPDLPIARSMASGASHQ
jgi:hypothetical protein